MNENLLRRGIEVEGRCKRCGVLETDRHVFFQCLFAAKVWNLILVLHKPVPGSISTPASLLLACHRMINLPPTGISEPALYPWVLWFLWVARNKLIFKNLVMNEQEVATLALKEARAWQAAQPGKTTTQTERSGNKVPQPCGLIKTNQCFVDAAWNATNRRGGFGCIFKDFSNIILHHTLANRCFVGSAFIAEALAVKTALLEAVNLGLRTLITWSDHCP